MTPPHGAASAGFGAHLDKEAPELPFLQRAKRLTGRLWPIIRPHQGWLWLSLLLLIGHLACKLTLPWLVMRAIDAGVADGDIEEVLHLAYAYLGVAAAEAVLRAAQMIALERAGQTALLDLRNRVFRHLQKLPAAFFDRTPIGRLVGRVTTDIEALQELFSSGVVTVIGDLLFLVAVLVILVQLSLPLTGAAMLAVPVLLIVTLWIRLRARAAYTTMRTRISQMNGMIHEQVQGMAVVQLFNRESRSRSEFREINAGVRNAQVGSVWWESNLSAITEMLSSFTIALIVWFGGRWALGDDSDGATAALTLGTLFAFVDYMNRFFIPLNDLTQKYTVLQNALVASDRVFALLDEPEEQDPGEGLGHVHEVVGSIEFDRVTFGYGPDNPVLKDVSFTVSPGETVALVGATGAGKTTILGLLTRLYEVTEGAVRLDGDDIRTLRRQDLRREVGVVSQDVFLFEGTILENLILGRPDLTEAQALNAAAELGLDEVVARFPLGYREPVTERGGNLSSGEKQLIAFARMLLAEPRILLLDEATAHVDSRTEELLQKALERLRQGRTVVVVAHRLSTVQDADRILVLHKGELIEQGPHADLMATGGRYADLYRLGFASSSSSSSS